MSEYQIHDGVALLTLDEGKVNAISSASLTWLGDQLTRAFDDDAGAVILTGKPGMFSAGFDLAEVRAGDEQRDRLRRGLIELELRIFEYERPVIVACNGHALAAGAALLLAADRRIGCPGPFKLGFNEVKVGVSISGATVELARYRMPMPWFESLMLGETFSPDGAQLAGLLDAVAKDESTLLTEAQATAALLAEVPRQPFLAMRRAVRGATADRVRQELAALG